MDITTILGIVLGAGVFVGGVVTSGKLGDFWDLSSLIIVIFGTVAAVISCFPLSTLKGVGKHFKLVISGKKYQPGPLIDILVEFAQIARKNGLLALEEKSKELDDPFFKRSIMLIVDAVEAERVKELLVAEVESMADRHMDAMAIYDKGASFAPAFGMMGTLIGLVNMLKNLNIEEGGAATIGVSMGVALITTLYGVMFANMIFTPISKKLEIRNNEEIIYRQIIIDGVLGIQTGDNPKALKERLVSTLASKQQAKLLDSEGGGGGGGKEKKSKKK